MNERINPFADLANPPQFETKPKAEKRVDEDAIARLSEQSGFPSRQAVKPVKARPKKDRRYRTGRNVQFHAKATQTTVDKIYKIADERKLMVAEVLELMLDAFEEKAGSETKAT